VARFDLISANAAENLPTGEQNRVAFQCDRNGRKRTADTPPNLHYHGVSPTITRRLADGRWTWALCCYNAARSINQSPLKVFDYMACGLTWSAARRQHQCANCSIADARFIGRRQPRRLGYTLLGARPTTPTACVNKGAAGRKLGGFLQLGNVPRGIVPSD